MNLLPQSAEYPQFPGVYGKSWWQSIPHQAVPVFSTEIKGVIEFTSFNKNTLQRSTPLLDIIWKKNSKLKQSTLNHNAVSLSQLHIRSICIVPLFWDVNRKAQQQNQCASFGGKGQQSPWGHHGCSGEHASLFHLISSRLQWCPSIPGAAVALSLQWEKVFIRAEVFVGMWHSSGS